MQFKKPLTSSQCTVYGSSGNRNTLCPGIALASLSRLTELTALSIFSEILISLCSLWSFKSVDISAKKRRKEQLMMEITLLFLTELKSSVNLGAIYVHKHVLGYALFLFSLNVFFSLFFKTSRN